ncbi:MAG: response regulator transcription factor [Phycisphaerae bacterium]|nr:response regulator transcription factor [Phycisphaerae bacterium]
MVTVDKIEIFLADDHAMVREGLAALVEADEGIEVVGQCGDGLKVVSEVLACNPDVVILDITMPGLNGLDICRELVKKCDGISVLVLTMHSNEQFIAQALENGATGYLLKESAAEKLNEAIRRVASGEIFLGPGIPRNVLQRLGQIERDPYQKLSTRERQVLQLIAEGKTNRIVAEVLGLSTKTVDTHRTRLMRKLNIHDQTSLVKFAIRKGIISVGE